jgi:integrase
VSSVNLALAALKGLSKVAFNMRLLDVEELARIQSVKRVRGDAARKGRSLEKSEVRALLGQSKQHPHASRRARDRALILLACGTGLRAGELVCLQLDDVELEHGKLVVRQGKGRKYRSIYVSKQVLSAMKTWLKFSPYRVGPLFNKIKKGGILGNAALTKAGFASILAELASNGGVEKFTPHDLRRTFITHLLEQGVDINTVRQLAGHSDIATTARYDCRGNKAIKAVSKGFSCW